MNIEPLNGRIVVEPIHPDNVTAGGIFIPEQAKDTPNVGKVVCRAEEWRNPEGVTFKSSIKEGDTVIFGKYAGSEIDLDGKTYILLLETDLFGKMLSPEA